MISSQKSESRNACFAPLRRCVFRAMPAISTQEYRTKIKGERNNMETYHILIVEDDKEIREGIEIYLKNQGYSVSQAADGIEGLQRSSRRNFISPSWIS